MAFIVNSLLAECAWGRLEAGPVWVPVGRLATDRQVYQHVLIKHHCRPLFDCAMFAKTLPCFSQDTP